MFNTYNHVKDFFQNSTIVYYMSPVQREYVWSAEHANKLVDELLKAPTFLGSITAKCQGLSDADNDISSAKTFNIIDGQQRVTTLYLILHVLGKTQQFDVLNDNKKFKYADEFTTNNMVAIRDGRYEDLDERSSICKVFKSLQEKIDKFDACQKQRLYLNAANSEMYITPVSEAADEAVLFYNINAKGTIPSIEQTVKAVFGENGDYSKWNNLMNSIKTNGRTAFLKAIAIYKNRKRMTKTEIINYYCDKNLNIDDMKKLWTYYAPVAKNSLFVKMLTLRMNCNGNKECDKIVKYLTKLDRFLIPYAHEYSNGAFMNGFFDFIMSLNDNFTLKTLKDRVNTYLKTKTNDFRKITIDNLRYDVDKNLIIDIFKEVKPDVAYNDLKPDKLTVEHIYPQTCSKKLSSDKLLHSLGNLTLLGKGSNSSIGNMPPEKKFLSDVYKNSGFALNKEFKNMTHWTEKDIENRHNELANAWFDNFFWKD